MNQINKLKAKLFLKRYNHLINKDNYTITIEDTKINIPNVFPINKILEINYIRNSLEHKIKETYRQIEIDKEVINFITD